MDLWFSLWLEVNQWLSWNRSGLVRNRFEYWDGVPDQKPEMAMFYEGEKANKIQQLLGEDLEQLGLLGNFLTSSPALCNNPDSHVRDRVISIELEEAIDNLLAVREHFINSRETTLIGSVSQVAKARMDRQ